VVNVTLEQSDPRDDLAARTVPNRAEPLCNPLQPAIHLRSGDSARIHGPKISRNQRRASPDGFGLLVCCQRLFEHRNLTSMVSVVLGQPMEHLIKREPAVVCILGHEVTQAGGREFSNGGS
jgi:hypothetical protein